MIEHLGWNGTKEGLNDPFQGSGCTCAIIFEEQFEASPFIECCDQHLVHLLVEPLRRVRIFLIPGAVLVGFLVNIPVISQTSTAVIRRKCGHQATYR